MGNEASLEGGEGLLSGLPEGLAPDGKGGFVRVPGGTPVDLSELSEEQRKQLEVAMARAQGRQPGGAARRPSQGDVQQRSPQAGASRGAAGLSKSRTVDAFNQGPVRKPSPGRSPSSLSLFESKFRQEPKSSESKSSGMFGSSFLSGANPLSAMTSSVSSSLSSMGDAVNIPKFGIFGDEEEGDAATANSSPAKGPQQQGPKGPQQGGPQKPGPGPQGQGPKPGSGPAGQGPKPGQGPPGQGPKPGQGPPGQGPKPGQGPPGQGPKPGQGPPGQGPKPGQGPPGQGPKPGQGPPMQGPKQGQAPPGQGPKPGQGPQGSGNKQGVPPQQKGAPPPQGPGQKQQGPPGAGGQPGATKSAGPPAQQGAEKPIPCPLCKTTQMNVGSKDPPNFNNCTECKSQVCSLCGFSPPDSAGKEWLCLNCQMQRAMGGMDPPNPKQGSVPPSPQKQAPGKPGNLLIKQQSHQSDQGLTPPTTPRQKSPGATSPGPPSPSSSMTGSPKIDPKTGKPIMPKSSPQQSPAKPKQESSFFGGLGGISLGGLTDSVKPAAASSQSDSVTGKLFGGFGGLMETSKPQTQAASKQEESVAGKLFGGFGGMSDTSAKPPAAASQMFSFGSSLLSSATNLVTGEDTKPAEAPQSPPQSPADSGPGSPPDSPFSAPGSPPDTDSAPDTPPAKFTKPPKSISVEAEEKPAPQPPKQSCPLCNTDLNLGSSDAPNYSLCTECKKTVCNLCGFNPTPHLGEKEWLCLNCQTQRAMSGQLGDAPPPAMASPKKQPPAPAAPAPTPTPVPPATPPPPVSIDNKPVVEPADLNPAAPDTKVENPITPIPDIPNDASITCPPDSPAQQDVLQTNPENHVTKNTQEFPAAMQKQNSSDGAEGGPKTEPGASDAEACIPVTVVAGDQEDKNTPIQPSLEESGEPNLSSKTEIDNTTALSELQPSPEISQSEAPGDKQEKVSPAPDELLAETADSDATKTSQELEATLDDCKEEIKQEVTDDVENAQPSPVILDSAVNATDTCVANSENTTDDKADKSVVEPANENTQSTSSGPVHRDKMMSAEPVCDPKSDIITETQSDIGPVEEKTESIGGTIEHVPTAETPAEEIVSNVKPEIENIVEETPDNSSAVEGAVVKMETVEQSAIERPVANKAHDEKAFEREQVVTEGPTEAAQGVENRQEEIRATVSSEEICSEKMFEQEEVVVEGSTKAAARFENSATLEREEVVAEGSTEAAERFENRQKEIEATLSSGEACAKKTELEDNSVAIEASKEDTAQAHAHIEEKFVSSEQTGSPYSNEQDATITTELLPSEDTTQASAACSELVKSDISEEQLCQSQTNSAADIQNAVSNDMSALAGSKEKQLEEAAESKAPETEKVEDFITNTVESPPVAENLNISISDTITKGENDTTECEIEQDVKSHTEQNENVLQLDSTPLVVKSDIPDSVVTSTVGKTNQEKKTEDEAELTVKPNEEDTVEVTVQ